ncbi:uncharacterized protein LOC134691547 [Mytilus trossulus]|uniref:uncharacterized protein LOC134691547 n=1 Tax=Mytilus trossulus TaxID=6551 RepID=UPI003003FFB2
MIPHVYAVIILYTVISLVLLECPLDAEHRIQLCIKSSLPNFGLGPPNDATPPNALKTSIEMSKDSCQSKKLESSAVCMQDFLDQCQGTTDREQLLQRLFDKDKMIETVRYFCSSLNIFEQNAECISNQHEMVINCSRGETVRYLTILQGNPTYDVLIQANCRFNKIATSCLENYVFENCGLAAAEFIETITIGQTPPSCETRQRKYSQTGPKDNSQCLTASIWTTLLLLFIKVLLK